MKQPKQTTAWYEDRKMLVFFKNTKPVLVLGGVLAEKTQIQFDLRAVKQFLKNNPNSGMNYEIIKRKEALEKRLNTI